MPTKDREISVERTCCNKKHDRHSTHRLFMDITAVHALHAYIGYQKSINNVITNKYNYLQREEVCGEMHRGCTADIFFGVAPAERPLKKKQCKKIKTG